MQERPWHKKADELYRQGYSGRKIAYVLGMSKTQVNDYLRHAFRSEERASGEVTGPTEGEHIVRANNPFKGLKNELGNKHLIIADTQVKPRADLTYLTALGNYIAEKKPDVIIHIGDHYDMESLSSYDKGKKSFEGRRVKADLDAGNAGMEALIAPFRNIKGYVPRMVFCCGNHEQRIDRFANDNPEFEGLLGTDLLDLEQFGWEFYDFLQPVEIDGIFYVHYLSNPFSGRPYGGTAMNQLKTVGNSFVVGHKQTLDIAIRPTIDGKMQIGIVNGAYYPHDEDYKGYQGNNHFRGITVLHDVREGYGDPMMVSLDYLLRRYAS